MNYQVLARKWRPHRFEDMVGQEHVLRALTNALDNNRLHHAYLFTGTRGVGKTTIARILAKSLNCEQGVSANPCGQCSACQDIDAGRFFDLIEVDAASRTKVDQTRELLENVPYAPTSGRYKVYLIDEVHMFSDHSFNALLKTLEEPPDHVKFLLATTDPQKVPVTVLSRCLQFSLKRLPERQISDYLGNVTQQEQCEAEEPALKHIARAADGSMRDALSLLDQAIAFGQGKVKANDVETMLGRPSPDRVLELVAALGKGEPSDAMQRVAALAEYSPDFTSLLADILSVLHQIALLQAVPGTQDTVSFDSHKMHELAVKLSPEDVHLFYQIGLLGRRDIALAPDTREGFEMTLLRMLAFQPNPEPESHSRARPVGRITPSISDKSRSNHSPPRTAFPQEAQVSEKPPGAPKRDGFHISEAPSAPVAEDSIEASASKSVAAIRATLSDTSPRRKAQKKTTEKAVHPDRPIDASPTNDIKTVPSVMDERQDWRQMIKLMGLKGMPLELANHCVLSCMENKKVKLILGKKQESLMQTGTVKQLETALSRLLEFSASLDITIAEDTELETPARIRQRETDMRLQKAKQAIENDPVVQKLCDQLEGVVQTDSIKPI